MKIDSLNEEIGFLKDHYMTEIDALRHEISVMGGNQQYYEEEEYPNQNPHHYDEERCTPYQRTNTSALSHNNMLGGAQNTFDHMQAELQQKDQIISQY